MTARFRPPWPAKSPWPSPSILSFRTMTRPGTGLFQMPVWTVLPRQLISRGKPTLTDTSRAPIFSSRRCASLAQSVRSAARKLLNFLLFEPQTFRHEDAVHSIEEELHQQSQQGSGNCALQNRAGVIQIESADYWLSQSADPDEGGQRSGTDVNDRAGFYPGQNRA